MWRLGALFLLFTPGLSQAESEWGLFSQATRASTTWIHPDIKAFETEILKHWALRRAGDGKVLLEIPTQTGRAALAHQRFGLEGQILLKGTGLNPETALDVAKIRYHPATGAPKKGDGYYGLREAWADLINSQMLEQAGVPVAKVRAIIELEDSHPTGGYKTAIIAREFVNQTRLSNLHSMSPTEARRELDRAIDVLFERGITEARLDREGLYFFLLERMAQTTARLQDIGYEHAYFHSQQVTLAGELADNGTGGWMADRGFLPHVGNERPDYFHYERQPILALNMFVRVHGLSQKEIARLEADSETLRKQTHSLLGVLMEIDPKTAESVRRKNPERLFWMYYRDELARLSQSSPQVYKSEHHFSKSWEEFIQKHPLNALAAADVGDLKRLFENLKASWQVNALPDEHLKRVFESQLLQSQKPNLVLHCKQIINNLLSHVR